MQLNFPQKPVRTADTKNPTPPILKAQLKSHKPVIPIRPAVNNRTSPTYKAAKKLNNILNQHLHLENVYTIENFTKLANDLTKITLKDSYRLNTLDIKIPLCQHPD